MPRPPGTKSTSRSGGLEELCVGTMDSPNLRVFLVAFLNHGTLLELMGVRVEASRESVRLLETLMPARASRGPKRSRGWKPSKRTKP